MQQRDDASLYRLLHSIVLLLVVLVALQGVLLWRLWRIEKRWQDISLGVSGPPVAMKGLLPGQQAPSFEVHTATGETLTLSMYTGQPLLLGFVDTSCPACQRALDALSIFQARYPSLSLLLFVRGELNQTLRGQVRMVPWVSEVAEAYRVPGVPWFFLIDAAGRIQASGPATTPEAFERLFGVYLTQGEVEHGTSE